jgi:anti-anti-sigma factor
MNPCHEFFDGHVWFLEAMKFLKSAPPNGELRYNSAMDRCPLCESFVAVAVDKPCYLCGLSFVERSDHNVVAVVPGWLLLDPAKPRFIGSILEGVRSITDKIVLDLSQVRFLNFAGIRVLVGLHSAVTNGGLTLVLAHVGPHVAEVFRICRLSKVFRIVDDVDDAFDIV